MPVLCNKNCVFTSNKIPNVSVDHERNAKICIKLLSFPTNIYLYEMNVSAYTFKICMICFV